MSIDFVLWTVRRPIFILWTVRRPLLSVIFRKSSQVRLRSIYIFTDFSSDSSSSVGSQICVDRRKFVCCSVYRNRFLSAGLQVRL